MADFRCPVDGRELADGQPCPDHGIAFTGERMTSEGARTVRVASTLAKKPAETPKTTPRKRTSSRGKT